MAVHESLAKIGKRTQKLLDGCQGSTGLSFNVAKGTEILRTCAAAMFDQKAEYYTSLEMLDSVWLDQIAQQTIEETIDLVDILDLDSRSRLTVVAELNRTLQARLKELAPSVPLDAESMSPGRPNQSFWRAHGGKMTGDKIGTSQFWQERRDEFLRCSDAYSSLKAIWKGDHQRWTLWWGDTQGGIEIPAGCERVLEAITKKAVLGLDDDLCEVSSLTVNG
jgi:hypothetical protein